MMKEFYEGLAEIFEVNVADISVEFDLNSVDAPWDSLAIVSTIALVDDCFNVMLDGQSLIECNYVKDIEALIDKVKGA
jgi:acyl carrier protein